MDFIGLRLHNGEAKSSNVLRYVYCHFTGEYVGGVREYNDTNIGYRPIVSIPIDNVQIAEGTGAVSIVDDNGNAIQ